MKVSVAGTIMAIQEKSAKEHLMQLLNLVTKKEFELFLFSELLVTIGRN